MTTVTQYNREPEQSSTKTTQSKNKRQAKTNVKQKQTFDDLLSRKLLGT